jgi:hypothetical protein
MNLGYIFEAVFVKHYLLDVSGHVNKNTQLTVSHYKFRQKCVLLFPQCDVFCIYDLLHILLSF